MGQSRENYRAAGLHGEAVHPPPGERPKTASRAVYSSSLSLPASRLDCRRCATSEADPHRTFNDDEDQVAMTQGRDAVHHAHGGGAENVVDRVLP